MDLAIKIFFGMALMAWQNWPTLLAKHYCFHFRLGVTFLSITNDSETNNSICQTMLAGFAKALGEFRNVKKHCISYATESLIFCKALLFFRIKHELLIVYSLFVYVIGQYCFILR